VHDGHAGERLLGFCRKKMRKGAICPFRISATISGMTNKLAYLAGLIDGEGCVGTYRSGKHMYFTIEIKMTSEAVIDWLVENFGGYKHARPSTNRRWQDQYRWRIRGRDAEKLYERISPMLLVK